MNIQKVNADNGFINFMSKVVAAGLVEDQVPFESLTRDQIIGLFPAYYAEMINGKLKVNAESLQELINVDGDENENLAGFSLTKSIKKIGNNITNSIKNPSRMLENIITEPIRILSPSLANKIESKIQGSALAKVLDAPSQYIIAHPQTALAVAACFTGGATLTLMLSKAAGVIGVQAYSDKMSKEQQELIEKEQRAQQAAYENSVLTQMDVTGDYTPPEIQIPGNADPKKMLAVVNSPEFYEQAKANALDILVNRFGYAANNPATLLMADESAKTSIRDLQAKLEQKLKGGSLIKMALPVAATLAAFYI